MFNKKTKDFEDRLTDLINNSGITVCEAYYIVENASLKLKLLYNEILYKEELQKQNFEEQQHQVSLEIPSIEVLETETIGFLPEENDSNELG